MSLATLKHVRDRCRVVACGCWLWQQSINSGGQPQACINGKPGQLVRRHAFGLWIAETGGRALRRGELIAPDCEGGVLCCNPEHMRRTTRSAILCESYASGTRSRALTRERLMEQARRNGWVRLDEARAREIHDKARAGALSRDLAAEFGVSKATINHILAGDYWPNAKPAASVFGWRPAP